MQLRVPGWSRPLKACSTLALLILAENPDWADLSLDWHENPGWTLVPDTRPKLKRKVRS